MARGGEDTHRERERVRERRIRDQTVLERY